MVAGCSDGSLEPSTRIRGDGQGIGSENGNRPFHVRRAEFATKLVSHGPSPQEFQVEAPPHGVREIEYQSGDLRLKAWLYVPQGNEAVPHTAVVYLHGGFAFGASDLYDCLPFMRAGYVVMTPMLRGENGLPGNYECYWGELDDAVAAVKWLHNQPFVDKDNVYVFGHSAGGQLASLLSLVEGVPVKHSGSSGGLYDSSIFYVMSPDDIPFDMSNPTERELRVLPGNVRWMHHKHYAFVGREDTYVRHGVHTVQRELARQECKLSVRLVEGGHGTSLPTAMELYIQEIKQGM